MKYYLVTLPNELIWNIAQVTKAQPEKLPDSGQSAGYDVSGDVRSDDVTSYPVIILGIVVAERCQVLTSGQIPLSQNYFINGIMM